MKSVEFRIVPCSEFDLIDCSMKRSRSFRIIGCRRRRKIKEYRAADGYGRWRPRSGFEELITARDEKCCFWRSVECFVVVEPQRFLCTMGFATTRRSSGIAAQAVFPAVELRWLLFLKYLDDADVRTALRLMASTVQHQPSAVGQGCFLAMDLQPKRIRSSC